jgi:hypothetical protein
MKDIDSLALILEYRSTLTYLSNALLNFRMQSYYPLPKEQQLRCDSSLPRFIRRIKQQLELYNFSDFARISLADTELPDANQSDMMSRRQASALIKQSITDEVLDQFPDEFTGRQIIQALLDRQDAASTRASSSMRFLQVPKMILTPSSTPSPTYTAHGE